MPSTYSPLKVELMATGENNTTWGDITNINLEAIEEALVGSADVTFASGNVTLTLTDTNAPQTARNVRLRCTGVTGGATRDLIVPPIEKPYVVRNDCADSVRVKTAAGTGITVPAGRTMWVYSDGVNVVDAVTHLTSLTLNTALPVTSGGTGVTTSTGGGSVVLNNTPTFLGTVLLPDNGFKFASDGATDTGMDWASDGVFNVRCNGAVVGTFTTAGFTGNAANVTGTVAVANGGTGATAASGARTNLGATTVGGNFFTLTNPSAITFPRINADNTVSALDAASFRAAIGAGSGSGTVTSVSGTGTVNGITLTGTVTSSGNLTLGGTLSGVGLTTQVTGTLPVANGGTGTATAFTAGSVVFAGASGTYSQDNTNLFWDDSNNRLGIGTVSPSSRLHIEQSGAVAFTMTTTGTWSAAISTEAAGNLIFQNPTATERMRIDASGDVGIGTSTPYSRLTVIPASTPASVAAANQINIGESTSNPAYRMQLGYFNNGGSGFNGSIQVFDNGNAEDLILNGVGGDVGIGTTPLGGYRLTTNGGAALLTTSGATLNLLPDSSSGANGSLIEVSFASGGFGPLRFNTGGSERMRLNSSGNLGVGASSYSHRLHVETANSVGSTFAVVANSNGAYPATVFGLSVGYNFAGGDANVDFWNGWTGATGAQGGFSFRRQTGASSQTLLLAIDGVGAVASPSLADAVGYKGLPQNAQGSGYTLVLADQGKHVTITGGVTIPANGSVAFPVGTTIVIYNNSGSSQTISITTDTLRLAGTASTGARTIAQRGLCTLVKVGTTEWVATGNVT